MFPLVEASRHSFYNMGNTKPLMGYLGPKENSIFKVQLDFTKTEVVVLGSLKSFFLLKSRH